MTMKTPNLAQIAAALLLVGAVIVSIALYAGPIGDVPAYAEQRTSCRAIGTYGYTGFGTIFPGNALGFPPGAASTNGTVTIDRNGQVTIVEAEMIDGVLISPSSTYAGTLTVNPDCTFSVTLPPLPGPAFVGVVVDNGNQVRAMTTIPGVQINYVSTVKVHPERSSQ
jgi:hypothetical protein